MVGNDITKCIGGNCAKRGSCYRFLAKPDRLQSYSAFFETIKEGECQYYWEVNDGDERNSSGTAKIV